MANILVIGASRGIGREVCRAATSRRHHVRAMSRGGTQPSGAASAEPFKGDALDAGAVAAALDGIDVVVQALGVPVSLDLFTKPVTLFSDATAVLIPEMTKAGVDTLIAVTGFGAGDSNRAINPLQRIPFDLALKRAYDDKSRQEAMIEDRDLDWLIVRPGVHVSAPACGRIRVLTRADEWRNGIISRAAVAEFIVDRIDQNQYGREKPVLVSLPL